jgi:hypothetical protein
MDAMKAESVEINDIEMYYETEGTGEPLLLLHGGSGVGKIGFIPDAINLCTNIQSSSRTHVVMEEQATLTKRSHTGSVRWTLSGCWIVSGSGSAGRLD